MIARTDIDLVKNRLLGSVFCKDPEVLGFLKLYSGFQNGDYFLLELGLQNDDVLLTS